MKLALFLSLLALLSSMRAPANTINQSTTRDIGGPMKLLFSGQQDVFKPWGKLHFGVIPVRLLRDCNPPNFTYVGAFPLPDGSWEVFGQQSTEIKPGNTRERIVAWKLLRTTTRDGVNFDKPETVFEQSSTWTDHLAIAKNGDTGEYLVLKLKIDISGFAYTAFFSADGKRWKAHPRNPLFYDGDAMSLFWSPVLHRFVCINKSLQPFRKHLVDHGGATPSLGDNSLRDRRVLMMRNSADGRVWKPSVSLADVWDLEHRKGSIPAKYLTKPDANDPPDLEFYSGNGFWYYDRAYMMVLNYVPSPLEVGKHAPQLDNEWWTSRDGLKWERPARDVNALEVFPQIPRLETHPMLIGGNIVFPRGNMLLGMPVDRISFVGARANGEFDTREFKMPDAQLTLNASVPSTTQSYNKDRAYVMVAILDDNDQIIPGYEKEKCVLRNMDRTHIPLRWGELSARQLAGRTIRLRIYLGSANVYAITTGN